MAARKPPSPAKPQPKRALAPKPGSVQARALAAQASGSQPPPGAPPTPPDRPRAALPVSEHYSASAVALAPDGRAKLLGEFAGPAYTLLREFVGAFDRGFSRDEFEPLIVRARALVRGRG